MNIEAIIVDLDGTLLDISERDIHARYEALRKIGYNVTLEEIKRHYRRGIGSLGILKELEISLTEKEIENYFNERVSSFTKGENAKNFTRIHRGVKDILESLSQRYKLILVTSRNKLSSVQEELKWFNIRQFFTLIVTREVAAKYHGVEAIPLLPFQEQRTRLYECVIGITKLNPKNIVCIGDSEGEIMPAKKMYMITIGVLTGISGKADLRKASDFIINDITQVNEVLSKLNI